MTKEQDMVNSEWGRRVGTVLKADGTVQVFEHTVTKEFVEKLEMSGVDGIVANVAFELRSRQQFQPWNLLFEGYAEDRREVFEVPEIRRWCAAVYDEKPFFPILLSEDSLRLFVFGLVDLTVLDRAPTITQLKPNTSEVLKVLMHAGSSAESFLSNCGVPEPRIMLSSLSVMNLLSEITTKLESEAR